MGSSILSQALLVLKGPLYIKPLIVVASPTNCKCRRNTLLSQRQLPQLCFVSGFLMKVSIRYTGSNDGKEMTWQSKAATTWLQPLLSPFPSWTFSSRQPPRFAIPQMVSFPSSVLSKVDVGFKAQFEGSLPALKVFFDYFNQTSSHTSESVWYLFLNHS